MGVHFPRPLGWEACPVMLDLSVAQTSDDLRRSTVRASMEAMTLRKAGGDGPGPTR